MSATEVARRINAAQDPQRAARLLAVYAAAQPRTRAFLRTLAEVRADRAERARQGVAS